MFESLTWINALNQKIQEADFWVEERYQSKYTEPNKQN